MKVLHICTADEGGAGLCCLRIHQALLKAGIDSKVLMLRTHHTDMTGVHQYTKGHIIDFLWRGFNKILRLCHLELDDYNRVINLTKQTKIYATLPTSPIDVSHHPLVKEADLIHLHWVDNFVDYPSFFRNIDKPIVWTLHDEGLFSGVFHFTDGRKLHEPFDEKYLNIKLKAVHQIKNLGIVFLSKMMRDRFSDDEMVKGRPNMIINNPVDCDLFEPVEKSKARDIMKIPQDAKVFSFVAGKIADPRKGLSVLSRTLQKMKIPNALIMAVGGEQEYSELPLVHPVGPVRGGRNMSIAYSCADYFVMPSMKEAFAQTPIESMACGVPAIVFPVSGTDELITPQNGVRADDFTDESLEQAIKTAMSTSYDSKAIRQDMITRFSPSVIAKEYISFYHQILKLEDAYIIGK